MYSDDNALSLNKANVAIHTVTKSCFVIHSNVTAVHISTYGGVRGRKIE